MGLKLRCVVGLTHPPLYSPAIMNVLSIVAYFFVRTKLSWHPLPAGAPSTVLAQDRVRRPLQIGSSGHISYLSWCSSGNESYATRCSVNVSILTFSPIARPRSPSTQQGRRRTRTAVESFRPRYRQRAQNDRGTSAV